MMGSAPPKKRDLNANQFAFPKQRKEPLSDASHIRNALARFDQVEGVTDAERSEAWKRIKAAADRFGVEVEAEDSARTLRRRQSQEEALKKARVEGLR